MSNVNFIKHFTGVSMQFQKDNRLNPTHVSMYLALFHLWNINRFSDTFYIAREEVMKMSKIGSRTTYHRCIRDLHNWNYIEYEPSFNCYKGSRVRLFNFETGSRQEVGQTHPINGQAVVHNINNYKQESINKQRDIKSIFEFFKKNNWPKAQAKRFFNHYEAVGWVKSNQKIENWKAAARSWMLTKEDKEAEKNTKNGAGQKWNNLHVRQNKNYDVPL